MDPLSSRSLVFLDASVIFAAALSAHGFARDLIKAGAVGDIELASCNVAFDEVRRNLAKKAPAAAPAFSAFERLNIVSLVDPTPELIREVAEVVESKDAPIVAGAIAANAQLVASFDRRHLLSQADAIREAFGLSVQTPEDVLRTLGRA